MGDIPLNSVLYLVGTGGAANEIKFELSKVREDITCIHIVPDEENTSGKGIIAESDLLKLEKEVLVALTVGNPYLRKVIHSRYKLNSKIQFPNIIFCDVLGINYLGSGNIIMPNVKINCNVTIGDFNYLNYGSFIAHDVILQSYNTLSPFSVVSGNCQLVDNNFLGSGSILNPSVKLENTTISSGTVVRAGTYNSVIMAQDFGKKYDKR